LAGTGVITVPPIPPPCVRPPDLYTTAFIYGYITPGPITTLTSMTQGDACSAEFYIQSTVDADDNYVDIVLLAYTVHYEESLIVGTNIYADNGLQDCASIADGWYFTEQSMFSNYIYHLVGGVIVEIYNCILPTTTTTTTPMPAVQTLTVLVSERVGGEIVGVTPAFYTLNYTGAFPVANGVTITGIVTAGGTTLSVEYKSPLSVPQILVIKNFIVVGNALGVQTVGPATATSVFTFNWTSTDIIEIRLI
jgi:hypothetical protein